MLDIFVIKPQAAGLDISDLSLKIAELAKNKTSLVLKTAASFDIPKGIIESGDIKNSAALIEILKHVSAEKKIKTKYVICSLPEEKAFLEVIRLPKMKPEELEKAVFFEAENYIPLPIGDVYLDFNRVPTPKRDLDHIDVLIAALPKKIVDAYARCLRAAGFYTVAMEIESLAISRAAISEELADQASVLLDLGATRTGFVIFSGRSLKFTASIPVSGQSLSQVIAKALNIDLMRAEELKIQWGLANKKNKEGLNVFEAIVPQLSALASEVRKYIDYYKTHGLHEHAQALQDKSVTVYLCGGGANLRGLMPFLSKELGLQVKLVNPWVNIYGRDPKELPAMSHDVSLAYTTALGLAIRGINKDY